MRECHMKVVTTRGSHSQVVMFLIGVATIIWVILINPFNQKYLHTILNKWTCSVIKDLFSKK